MSYIGRALQAGAFRQLDDISSGFDGSTTGFTMQVNSGNVQLGDVNQILLSLGGVIQKPGTDFTVSGSTLTFTTAPAANTNFFAILLGSDNGGTVTPTDGSVTTGKIAADAITSAKIADDAVTGDHIASSGAFTIGATGTASTLAGIPFFSDTSNYSIYTHDVSGTDSTAQYNASYGLTALDAITTGDKITAMGYGAGGALTTGGANIAIGFLALSTEDTGTQNVAIGNNALGNQNNDTDGNNVCIGFEAGEQITTGRWNHFIGTQAGDDFDTEHSNLGIGYRALGGSIAGGEYNIAIGNSSGDAVTSGDANTFVGYYAGTDYTTGSENTAIGAESAINSTTGSGNTTLGFRSVYENTATGSENTCLGAYAGYRLTSGASNTIVGYDAGTLVTTGGNNLLLGMDAGVAASPSGSIGTGSNNICLGNNNISALFCATSTITTSDRRDKTDIENFNLGLEWIEKLQPVTYRWDRRTWYGDKDNVFGTPDGSKKWENLELGFIAQDVLNVEKSFGYGEKREDMITVNLTEDGMYYGMKYERLVTVLVNAVKELSAKVKALEEA